MGVYSLPQKDLFSEYIENTFDEFRRTREQDTYQEFVTDVSQWESIDTRWKKQWRSSFYCSDHAYYSISVAPSNFGLCGLKFPIGDGRDKDKMIETNDLNAMQEQANNYLEYAKGLAHILDDITIELFIPELDNMLCFKERNAFSENEKTTFPIVRQVTPEKSSEIKDKIVQHMITGIAYRNAFDDMIISCAKRKLEDINRKAVRITPNIAHDFPVQPSN